MLEAWLDTVAGPDHFFTHIQRYLLAHSYGNAQTADLWGALDDSNSAKERYGVGEFMSTWTDQPGFPVVSISHLNNEGEKYLMQQQRLFYGHHNLHRKDWTDLLRPTNVTLTGTAKHDVAALVDEVIHNNQSWIVPVSWRLYEKDSTGKITLITIPAQQTRDAFAFLRSAESAAATVTAADGSITITTLKDKTPVELPVPQPGKDVVERVILANLNHAGVFHVNYPEPMWNTIADWLQKDLAVFDEKDRAGLFIDAFALSWSGHLGSVTTLFSLTRFLTQETSLIVWKVVIQEFNVLEAALSLHSSYGHFRRYQRGLLRNIVDTLGWEEKDLALLASTNVGDVTTTAKVMELNAHARALLRSELLSEMVATEDPRTVAKALEYYRLLRGKAGIPTSSAVLDPPNLGLSPDVLNVIYDTGIIYGTESDYDFIIHLYKTATFAADQRRLLHALASMRRPYLQQRTLSLAITVDPATGESVFRKQDVPWLITQVAVLGGELGVVVVWDFLRSRWKDVVKFWKGSGWKALNDMVGVVISRFRQTALVEEAERLFIRREDQTWFVPPLSETAVRKGLEKFKTRIRWVQRNGDDLEAWFKKE
ncbi:hypothetical protein HK102_009660, partial [Quaeritorhiza haematococci]